MPVGEMMKVTAGATVRVKKSYSDWLQAKGPHLWLPNDDALGVVLFSYGSCALVVLADAGPGFTLIHNGDVMGAMVVPVNELILLDGKVSVRQRGNVASEYDKWHGATAPVVTLYLMGMQPKEIREKCGVTRQYIHASTQRIQTEMAQRGFSVYRTIGE